MAGRRKLSYPQVQALQALGEHRAKILSFTAEFEARKTREYNEATTSLRDEEAQLVAQLLDLGTPKIRIAEVMGTKNYGNLAALDEAAKQYRKYPDPDPIQGVETPKSEEIGDDVTQVEVKTLLKQIHKFQRVNKTNTNEYDEWEETWTLGGASLTFLCWEDGHSLLFVNGLTYLSATLAMDHYAHDFIEGIYGEEGPGAS